MKTPADIIQTVLAEGRKALLEPEARELARSVGIVVPKYEIVDPSDGAKLADAAESVGYPVAVKAVSPHILHKTDAGAVMLDIKNKAMLTVAAKQIARTVSERAPGAVISGLLVERMMPAGPELLIGGLRDVQFGPALAFGLGGIWTEMLKDAVFGILPLTDDEMIEMIERTKAAHFFRGSRGTQPLDRTAALSVMRAVAKLLIDHPQISEIDLNPVRVYGRGAAALDVRILLKA